MSVYSASFFNRPADQVARSLIGAVLCYRVAPRQIVRLPITETEAYMGPHDRACHAARGYTPRTKVLYEKAGTIYIYLIYGMFTMVNVVTGEAGYPAAVLIRGAGSYTGPGKLTRGLGISRNLNGRMLGRRSGLWILSGKKVPDIHIQTTPRINVPYAGEWADVPLRFVYKDSSLT